MGISHKDLAEMRDCSERHLFRLMNDDTLRPKLENNSYSFRDAGAFLMREGRKTVLTGTDGLDYDYTAERARLAAEQADGQAIKNDILRHDVAPIDALMWAVSRMGEQVAAVLSTIPGKLKRRLPIMTQEDVDWARREIAEAQNLAAESTVNLDDYETLRRSEGDQIA